MSHSTRVLKTKNGVQLVQNFRLKYFKNGRANMHIERSYHVENTINEAASRYWISTKADAEQYFNQVVRSL